MKDFQRGRKEGYKVEEVGRRKKHDTNENNAEREKGQE